MTKFIVMNISEALICQLIRIATTAVHADTEPSTV